jgi:arsenate reductase
LIKEKIKVLFVCIHNSARSQMAEAFLKEIASDRFIVESAGLEPGKLNPLVVESMFNIGIDISGNKTKSIFDLKRDNKQYDYVIAVCDEASSEKCPYFPGLTKKLNWNFRDPSELEGNYEEKLKMIRNIRDEIKGRVREWLSEINSK